MKYILTLALIFGVSLSSAALPIKSKCKQKIVTDLKKQFPRWKDRWIQEISVDQVKSTFRSPVSHGQWLELHELANKSFNIDFLSPQKSQRLTWTKSCKKQIRTSKPLQFSFFENHHRWTDKDLDKLLQRKKSGVVYLWSPHMVYSLTEMDRFKKTITDNGLEFTAVVDPTVTDHDISDSLKSIEAQTHRGLASNDDKTQKMESIELFMRHGMDHYPTFFVYSNGQLNPNRIVGVHTNQDLLAQIEGRIRSGKK